MTQPKNGAYILLPVPLRFFFFSLSSLCHLVSPPNICPTALETCLADSFHRLRSSVVSVLSRVKSTMWLRPLTILPNFWARWTAAELAHVVRHRVAWFSLAQEDANILFFNLAWSADRAPLKKSRCC